jgi:hypothetical protein
VPDDGLEHRVEVTIREAVAGEASIAPDSGIAVAAARS